MSSLQNTSLLHVFSSAISSTHSPHSHRKVLQQLLQFVLITYSHIKKHAVLCIVRTSSDRYSSNLPRSGLQRFSVLRGKNHYIHCVSSAIDPPTRGEIGSIKPFVQIQVCSSTSPIAPRLGRWRRWQRGKGAGSTLWRLRSTELHHCSASRRAAGVNPSL